MSGAAGAPEDRFDPDRLDDPSFLEECDSSGALRTVASSAAQVRVAFRAALEAGVPRIALRDLRHVHASLLVRGGLDPKSLQAHLGHSRASLSLDVYAYSLPAGGRVVEAWDLVMGS